MPAGRYRFDNFELDISKRRLLRNGEVIALNPKAFDMLRVLIEHNGELLTKDDLLRLVWDGQFVEEANLTVNMSAIRKALGENPKSPRYITTVSGRGYYFTAEVERAADNGFVVANVTHSRITLTEEEELESPQEREHRLLPPAHQRSRLSVGLLIAILIAAAGGFAYYWFNRATPLPFSKMRVQRLTTSGRVTAGALSPDGRLFGYSHQEADGRIGIALEHVEGTNRIQLLEPGEHTVANMTFTPDGKQLYYAISSSEAVKNGLYRLPAFGGPPEFVKEGVSRISFSPDASRYVFVKADSNSRTSTIRIAETASGTETTAAERSSSLGFIASTIDWSRDGEHVAVSAVTDESTREQEVFLLDTSSGDLRALTNSRWNGVRALAWLPYKDGLVATAGDQDAGWEAQLWHISAETGIANRLITDLNTYGVLLNVSADGKSLLTGQAQFYSNIWVAPADDLASARQVTFDMIGRQNGWDGLDWTVDGKILHTSYLDRSETIWSLDPVSNVSKQLIPSGRRNMLVSVSQDKGVFAFESNRSGSSEIWIASIDGSDMRQLTSGGSNFQPSFSPDGTRVIYQSVRDGVGSLWEIDLASGRNRQLHAGRISWAQFSHDGRFIAGAVAADRRTQIGILDSESGEIVKTFDLPAGANVRLGIHWTPDDSAVTYRDWSNGIWRQSTSGGPPARIPGIPEEKIYAYGWSRDGKQFAFSRGMEIRDAVLITEDR